MCYSGRCQYEGHMGDCRVSEYKKIKDLTGHDACYIGGGITKDNKVLKIEIEEDK